MKFRPIHDRVIVRRLSATEKTRGGIMGIVDPAAAVNKKAA